MMADGSHPPTFKGYGVERRCYGCGRKLGADDAADFRTTIRYVANRGLVHSRAVYGTCCYLKP
jgi:hypothetical protein